MFSSGGFQCLRSVQLGFWSCVTGVCVSWACASAHPHYYTYLLEIVLLPSSAVFTFCRADDYSVCVYASGLQLFFVSVYSQNLIFWLVIKWYHQCKWSMLCVLCRSLLQHKSLFLRCVSALFCVLMSLNCSATDFLSCNPSLTECPDNQNMQDVCCRPWFNISQLCWNSDRLVVCVVGPAMCELGRNSSFDWRPCDVLMMSLSEVVLGGSVRGPPVPVSGALNELFGWQKSSLWLLFGCHNEEVPGHFRSGKSIFFFFFFLP